MLAARKARSMLVARTKTTKRFFDKDFVVDIVVLVMMIISRNHPREKGIDDERIKCTEQQQQQHQQQLARYQVRSKLEGNGQCDDESRTD
jgi:hypothetical protein